jgi:hypothetical protein
MKRELLPNCFLKEKNVDSRLPKEISKLVSAPSAPKTSNIPNERSHLETMGEARAWRAGVFLKNLGAGREDRATDFLATRFGLGIPGINWLSVRTGHGAGNEASALATLAVFVASLAASAARVLSSSARLEIIA